MIGAYGRRGLFRGWDRFDYFIILAAMALVALGLALIYSGSSRTYTGPTLSFANPVVKQAVFAVLGFVAMLVFLAILVVGFIYEWKKGALEWE